ncbi:ParB/RepB/Spo0J family partition protein [Streptomyces sp. NPDC093223]|uniref:ParB/RepB/Spo0J family partition protein n=1 Tax=Streptomyces sp. NPDC093223 TaxID=3366033 RepID=UPI0038026CDE
MEKLMPKKPGLARDLATERRARQAASQQARLVPQGLPTVHPDQLMPSPENGRKKLLRIHELADTLRTDGMNTAMTVIPPDVYVELYPQHKETVEQQVAAGVLFVVHHGHRRLAAARAAGLESVPILVRREVVSPRIAGIQENLQRMSLNPLEEAHEFQAALDEQDDTGKQLSQRELAKRVGCSQTYVSHRMALLRLVPVLQQAVVDHWEKEQKLLEGLDETGAGERLLLPVREAATVYARLRPDLQEAFLRGELTAAQAVPVSKLDARVQAIPTASDADAESSELRDPAPGLNHSVPEPRPGGQSDPSRSPQQTVRESGSPQAVEKALPVRQEKSALEPVGRAKTDVPERPEPRGVIVVESVSGLAASIRDLLTEDEIGTLAQLLSS